MRYFLGRHSLVCLLVSAAAFQSAGCARTRGHRPAHTQFVRAAVIEPQQSQAAQTGITLASSQQSITADDQAVVTAAEDLHEADFESPSNGTATLVELEQLAVENNPALSELYSSIQAAQGIRFQVGQKANPVVGYFGNQIADARTDQHGVFVDQELVRGTKLRLNQSVLDQTIHRLVHEVEVQRFRVLTDVRQLYAEAVAAQETEHFCREFSLQLAKGLQVAEDRRRVGEGTTTEILQVQVFRTEVELLMRQSHQRFIGFWNELVAVAGVPDLQPRDLESIPYSIEAGENTGSRSGASDANGALASDRRFDSIFQLSPELASARARVAEAQAYLARQQAQTIPNLHMQLGVGTDYATGSGLLNVQMGAPLPVYNQNRGNIQAACAEYNRALFNVRRVEMNLRSRFARATQELQSGIVSVEQFDHAIVPNAAQLLNLAEIAYQAGELEFLNVLVARRTYFDAKLKAIAARRDVNRAHAHLEGMLLTGGLDAPEQNIRDDSTRGQSLTGQ